MNREKTTIQQYKAHVEDITRPDERNIGGRVAVVQQMKCHHKALMNVKPVTDSHTAPRPHVNKISKQGNGKKIMKQALEQEEMKGAFRKVANQKTGYVDVKQPKTYEWSKKMGSMHTREKKFINQEHELNLKSQKRRLKEVGRNMVERKKNPNDPIVYPVRFFRRDPTDRKAIDLDPVANKIINRRDVIIPDNQGLLKASMMKNQDQAEART